MEVSRVAATAEDGVVRLLVPADDHALTNALLVQGLFLQKGAIQVQAVRLDTFVANRNLGRVGPLKLDCECAETAVFHGSEKLLSEARPDAECEVLPPVAQELAKLFIP